MNDRLNDIQKLEKEAHIKYIKKIEEKLKEIEVYLEDIYTFIKENDSVIVNESIDIEAIIREKFKATLIISKRNDLEEDISGYIKKIEGERYEIGFNAYDSFEKSRFTLGHELGHFLIHRNILDIVEEIKDSILYRSKNSEITKMKEYQANVFSARLLIPKYRIQEIFKNDKKIKFLESFQGKSINDILVPDNQNIWRMGRIKVIDENLLSKLSAVFKVSDICMKLRLCHRDLDDIRQEQFSQ